MAVAVAAAVDRGGCSWPESTSHGPELVWPNRFPEAAYRPRDVAKQRELLSTSNGRPEAVSGCLCRSAVGGALIWGTEGPEFKSRQPDRKSPRCLDQEALLAALLVGP